MNDSEKWTRIVPKPPHNYNEKFYRWNNKVWDSKIKKNPVKCGCIIFNHTLDEIVLVQNKYMYDKGVDKWGLPKGHLENNEGYGICASRETTEETGLNLTIYDSMYKIKINNTYYFPIKIKRTLKNKYLLPKDLVEIRSAKWFPLDNIDVLVNRETRLFITNKINTVLQKLKELN
uniref:Nudix hydrolase domain-containing protein n=1 Tax=viral metagenome TaxID=1070528 RepID=A0A6C0EJ72_9ZZZZ